MKLPSFSKLVEDFKKQVASAILKALDINEVSFSEHHVSLTNIKVKQEEYSGPKLLVAVDVAKNPLFYGFSIQCVFKDKHDELIDVSNSFVDLRAGKGGLTYSEIYLPEDLADVEKIEMSLQDPIYEEKPTKENKNAS